MLAATSSGVGASVLLQARLTDSSNLAVNDAEVVFSMMGALGTSRPTCTGVTDEFGDAQCTLVQVPADLYTVSIGFEGITGCLDSSNDEVFLAVFDPDQPRVTGGGFFYPDAESTLPAESISDKASFGFAIHIKRKQASADGNFEFKYRAADINLKSLQIDDAYLGGERNGGKRGRGSENKRPFVIAVATDEKDRPGYAVIEPGKGFTKAAIIEWGERRLRPDAAVYSDGLKAFGALAGMGYSHTVIQGASPRQACEAERVRWVNVVLSNLKRALDGTYHVFCFFKYAHRYLGEAAWRFNRRFRLEALVPRLLEAAARCQPWPEAKLRNVPVYTG